MGNVSKQREYKNSCLTHERKMKTRDEIIARREARAKEIEEAMKAVEAIVSDFEAMKAERLRKREEAKRLREAIIVKPEPSLVEVEALDLSSGHASAFLAPSSEDSEEDVKAEPSTLPHGMEGVKAEPADFSALEMIPGDQSFISSSSSAFVKPEPVMHPTLINSAGAV